MLGNKKQSSVSATNGKSSVHILNVKAYECAVRTFKIYFFGKVLHIKLCMQMTSTQIFIKFEAVKGYHFIFLGDRTCVSLSFDSFRL